MFPFFVPLDCIFSQITISYTNAVCLNGKTKHFHWSLTISGFIYFNNIFEKLMESFNHLLCFYYVNQLFTIYNFFGLAIEVDFHKTQASTHLEIF